MESEKTYFYPVLSDYDFGWFRLSGPGLANCMFVAARAYILSRRENAGYISPTWTKLSPGTFLRREKDKRVYFKIFNKLGISGFKKIRLLLAGKLRPGSRRVKQIRGMGEYFDDLNEHMDLVHEFIEKITRKEIIENVRPEALKDSIAIHVRLGDYSPEMRVDILWYVNLVREILSIKDKLNRIMAEHTGQPLERLERDTDRDNFMSSDEAAEYGLIDKVLTRRDAA